MNLFDRFLRKPDPMPLARKESAAFALHFINQPTAQWSARNYPSFVTEAYRQNVIAFRAINLLATAISSLRWQAVKGGKVLDAHPILDLLARPNPLQSGTLYWRTKIIYLYLSGSAFDERTFSTNPAFPAELWTLRPDRMTIEPSPTGLPAAFEYRVHRAVARWEADPITGQSDIDHIKFPHPLDDTLGLSPVEAGAYAIDQHNEAMRWMQSLLQNSARPSGALVVPSETRLSDEQFRRLKKETEEAYAGSKNAGRPMLLEGDMKWQQFGLSPDDMTFIGLKDSAARDIALAFDVPPLLLGIPGDNTYSNYREARLGFYEDSVIPLARFLISSFNDWMSPYLDGVTVQPDIDAIEAVADKRRALWQMVDSSDEITLNEARNLKGLPPHPDPELGKMLMADLRSSRRGHDTPGQPQPEGGNNADGTQNSSV